MSTRVRPTAIVAVACLLALGACSSDAADVSVTVTGTNDSCSLSADELQAGNIGFEFNNDADDVNELYVVKADGDVVGEVENVTTGTTRTLTANLVAGDYLVRCKPGQSGDGIESSFRVVGDGGAAQAAPDRTTTFDAVEFRYPDLDADSIVAGETIRFEMTNAGTQPHEFEVIDPNGDAIGEVAAVKPGASGGATMTFEAPGVYRYRCILVDPNTGDKHSELGMKGTFEVTSN